MLSESHLPLVFWGEALAAYVHVWNRLWTSTLKGKTPFEMVEETGRFAFTSLGLLGLCACAEGQKGWIWITYGEVRVYWVP